MHDHKVVVFGVAGLSKAVINQQITAGKLPTFAALMTKGRIGAVTGPAGFYTGSSWPSFNTGLKPGRHGVYSAAQIKAGSYATEHISRSHRMASHAPFWNQLSEAGRRIAIFDLPHTVAPQSLNGVQISQWATHDYDLDGPESFPPNLVTEISDSVGPHPLNEICDHIDRDLDGFRGLRDGLVEGVARKAAITCDLLAREPWDLMAVAFPEAHCAQHQCWHLHDPEHPVHDKAMAAALNPVADVYDALDEALRTIAQEIGEQTTFVLVSESGMGAKYNAHYLLTDILLRLGVAVGPVPKPASPKSMLSKAWQTIDPFVTRAWQTIPPSLRARLAGARDGVRGQIDTVTKPPPAIDRQNSDCFMLPSEHAQGAIRLNLVGREPNGRIEPGNEMVKFCDALEKDLRAIVNTETGEPIVSKVVRTREAYPGPYCDDLPDLMIEWNNRSPIAKIASDKIGTIEGQIKSTRTGDHRWEGFFVAVGPHIANGTHPAAVDIVDFAPTIGQLVGVPLKDMDGTAVDALVPNETTRIAV